MKRSTDRARQLAAASLVLLLAACGSVQQRPPSAEPSPTTGEAQTEPDKGNPQQRFDVALQMLRDGQVGEAEEAFRMLAQDFPEHAGPWTNLGILFARSNRRPQAIGALARAAQLKPDNKIALNWLGILYRESGDFERARASYERALAIDSGYAFAHYNLGLLLDAHLRRPTDALPHYREYLRLTGGDDLRVMAWVAQIEAENPPAEAPASAALPDGSEVQP